MAAQAGKFALAVLHFMAAIAAPAMRTVELSQLHAAPGELKQTDIFVNQLAHRGHIVRTRFAYQPDVFAWHSPITLPLLPVRNSPDKPRQLASATKVSAR